jgi:hypothetical protein
LPNTYGYDNIDVDFELKMKEQSFAKLWKKKNLHTILKKIS